MKKAALKGKKVAIGVCGSIAAYKTCELTRRLVDEGASVVILLTRNALNFVTPLTFKTLSGHPVIQDIFDEAEFDRVTHVGLAHWADLILISPATANIIGKVASGIADDVVTTTVMATRAQVLFAPAMNDQMYENVIFQENLKKLERLGYHFVPPERGYLACGYEGMGRLASLEKILEKAHALLKMKKSSA